MIEIITRDEHGKWETYTLNSLGEAHNFCHELAGDEDEILLVILDGVCIYSALANAAITWEDLAGFFA